MEAPLTTVKFCLKLHINVMIYAMKCPSQAVLTAQKAHRHVPNARSRSEQVLNESGEIQIPAGHNSSTNKVRQGSPSHSEDLLTTEEGGWGLLRRERARMRRWPA